LYGRIYCTYLDGPARTGPSVFSFWAW